MSFLAPLTLVGLVLLALPVLIHLLVRRRARRLDFPSLRFLRETPSFRLYPRHVRQPLLLALRLAALALIVVGLARPFISLSARSRHTRVILIDASLSMSTRGRMEAAREQARAILNKLDAGEEAGLVAFSSGAWVLAEATRDREALARALQSYEPVGGAADYSVGLAKASAMLQQVGPGTAEIDLISDFQESGLAGRAPQLSQTTVAAEARVVPYAVGAEVGRNAFLTDETVTRNSSGITLSATEIVSEPDGQKGTLRSWTIDASDGARPDVEWHTQANGQITGVATASAPDDFDADDQRFFAFAPPRENRALLVETDTGGGGGGPYLRAALEAASSGGQSDAFALDRRTQLPGSVVELNPYALVVSVLHGAPRVEEVRLLTEYASAGGTVWLCLARDVDTDSWNALADKGEGSALPFVSLARIASTQPYSFGALDSDAPALRGMNDGALSALRATRVRAGFAVTPRGSASTLARWSDAAPALVSAEIGAGGLLLLGTSPERDASDLGLSPALPALVGSILNAARIAREPLSRITGEPVQLGIRPETDVGVTDAFGHTTRVKARELAQRSPGVFSKPGIYRVEFAGQQRFLAFNAPGEESARALASAEEIKSYLDGKASAAAPAAKNDWLDGAERRGYLWRLFLCAAFILLVAELFFAMRGRERARMKDEG